MNISILLNFVIISQLFLLSYYYPRKIIDRIHYMLTHYPASDYPKLYPGNNKMEKAGKSLRIFKLISWSTLTLGIILLLIANITHTEIKDSMVVIFGLIQFIPFALLEKAELNHYRLMRTENQNRIRSADLKRRRYFDYISPTVLITAVITFLCFIAFSFYRIILNQTFMSDGVISLTAILLMHLYFATLVVWVMYGKKINPLQTAKDREIYIGSVIRMTVYVSIAANCFMLIYGLLQLYQLDPWKPVALSLYFQLCIYLGLGTMLRTNKIEHINFEVYRENKITI